MQSEDEVEDGLRLGRNLSELDALPSEGGSVVALAKVDHEPRREQSV